MVDWTKNTKKTHWTHGSHRDARAQLRKLKGTSVGGQFAVDPNGPMSAGRQAQLLGKHPEDLAKAEFKRKKKEAMDRFLARQRKEREEQHAAGLPGPVTIKKLNKLKMGNQPPGAQLRNKLRKLERVAHAQGKIGFNTLIGQGQALPGNPKVGDINAVGKIWNGVKWQSPIKLVPLTPAKGDITLRREKHERHVVDRAKKDAEQFRLNKNIAAKRHNAKVAGRDFKTPANPNFNDRDQSGKFEWRVKRGIRGGRLFDKKGNPKGEWRLIRTELRGDVNGVPRVKMPQQGQMGPSVHKPTQPKDEWRARHNGDVHPAWPADVVPVVRKDPGDPYAGGHKDANGKVLYVLPWNEQGHKGVFVSEVNDIAGDGRGILKSNGWHDQNDRGYAYREIAAYKIDNLLGLGVVPFTEEYIDNENHLNDLHGDFHSLQHFVKAKMGDQFGGYGKKAYSLIVDKTEVSKVALVDILFANSDRHNQNYMIGEGHIYAIDNGLTMRQTGTDAVDEARGWGSELRDYAQSEPPLAGHNMSRYKLNSAYKTKLEGAIKDGSLQSVIDWVDSGATPAGGKGHTKYVLKRAQSLVDHWDEIFSD